MVARYYTTLLLLGAMALSGCAMVVSPVNGFWYTNVQYAGNIGKGQEGAKTGEACAMSILGLIAMGDASLEAAMEDGGVKELMYFDHDAMSVLGLFSKFCTRVIGK